MHFFFNIFVYLLYYLSTYTKIWYFNLNKFLILNKGETDDEIIDTLYDLKDVGVDIVTFG